MRLLTNLAIAFLSTHLLLAGELNQKILKLIGPDARIVTGMDVERYRDSPLQEIFPWKLDAAVSGAVHQLIIIQYGPRDNKPPLTILTGSPKGVQTEDGPQFAQLDAGTTILGDPASIEEARRRWRSDQPAGEIADQVRRLSGTYDNWFLIVKPLQLSRQPDDPSLKYRDEVMRVVEQVRMGVRLGAFNEMHIEVVTRTPEDAATLAALGKWLPGLVQMANPLARESMLINQAENLNVFAGGNVASLSFTLSKEAIEKAIKSFPARPEW
jgi:hypothetical protein